LSIRGPFNTFIILVTSGRKKTKNIKNIKIKRKKMPKQNIAEETEKRMRGLPIYHVKWNLLRNIKIFLLGNIEESN
jgi:hypothetical protein